MMSNVICFKKTENKKVVNTITKFERGIPSWKNDIQDAWKKIYVVNYIVTSETNYNNAKHANDIILAQIAELEKTAGNESKIDDLRLQLNDCILYYIDYSHHVNDRINNTEGRSISYSEIFDIVSSKELFNMKLGKKYGLKKHFGQKEKAVVAALNYVSLEKSVYVLEIITGLGFVDNRKTYVKDAELLIGEAEIDFAEMDFA